MQVDDALHNRTCGLCGQYDGDKTNDFFTQRKEVVSSVSTFASDYRVLELTTSGSKVFRTLVELSSLLNGPTSTFRFGVFFLCVHTSNKTDVL